MTCIVCDQDIKDSFNRVTEYSAYAYEKNLAEGVYYCTGRSSDRSRWLYDITE